MNNDVNNLIFQPHLDSDGWLIAAPFRGVKAYKPTMEDLANMDSTVKEGMHAPARSDTVAGLVVQAQRESTAYVAGLRREGTSDTTNFKWFKKNSVLSNKQS